MGELHPEAPVTIVDDGPGDASVIDGELLSEREILEGELRPIQQQGSPKDKEGPHHGATTSSDEIGAASVKEGAEYAWLVEIVQGVRGKEEGVLGAVKSLGEHEATARVRTQ